MTQPPKRLLESAEPTNPARQLLELGRMHAPVAYDVRAGAARFEAALAAQAAVAAGGDAAPLVNSAKLGKLCLLLSPVIIATALLVTQAAPAPPQQAAAAHTVLVEVPAPVGATPSPLPPEPIAPAGAGTSVVEAQPVSAEAAQQPARGHATSRQAAGGVVQRASSVSPERAAPPRAESMAAEGGRARARAGLGRASDSARPAAASGSSTAPREREVLESRSAAAASGRSTVPRESRSAERGVSPSGAPSNSGSATPAPRTTDSIGELEGLARARRLTRQDPHAAVELLERLARAHPRGHFVEEREALLVMALSQAGQSGRASQLGAAFLRKYPASPLADSVRTAVDR